MSISKSSPGSGDKYCCFAELKSLESDSHYAIESIVGSSSSSSGSNNISVICIAIHGGKIEPLTSEIARLIARQLPCSASYYSFIGKKPSCNRDLHITSVNFDEPICVDLVARHEVVLSFHGCGDSSSPPRSILFVGGGNREVAEKLATDILPAHGFARENCVFCDDAHRFAGTQMSNIVNRSALRFRGGIQLECTIKMRTELVENAAMRAKLAEALFVASNMIVAEDRDSIRAKNENPSLKNFR